MPPIKYHECGAPVIVPLRAKEIPDEPVAIKLV
jgi:hypothetical protein